MTDRGEPAPDSRATSEHAPIEERLELPGLDARPQGGRFDTSPAWELELLISGAIVVGLFALPGIIERVFARFEPHATTATIVPLFLLHIYLLSAGYALLIAFTIHFCARAYWVGLIGLNSVFPGGMRWDRMSVGPAVTAVYRKRLSSPRQSIERIDNFCSILFSFAFMIVIVLVYTIALMAVCGGIGWAIAHLFAAGRDTGQIVEVVVFVYLAFCIATITVDKRMGHKLPPTGTARRRLDRLATAVYYMTPTAITGPILLTLTSNLGRRKMISIFQVAVFAVLALAAADRFVRGGRLRMNSYDYFTTASPRSVNYQHYADERPAGERYGAIAYIQSETISGPYVTLFVPYTPSVDNGAVASRCPALRPLSKRGVEFGAPPAASLAAADTSLGCLATLHPVTLDGQPVQPDYDFYQDPATGLRGMLAHIPAGAIATGRHLLVVATRIPGDSTLSAQPQYIPFWR